MHYIMSEKRFLNKSVLITGAGSGIGKAIAHRLAYEGCNIIALDRDFESLKQLGKDLPKGSLLDAIIADISDENAVSEAVIRTIGSSSKDLDFLVNAAGIDHLDNVAECSLQDWRRVLSVNLDGTFLMCRAVVNQMIKQGGGKIVNIASWLAKAGMAGHSPYAASKFGIIGLTQSLAKEVAVHGITVNSVCPGPIDHTGMREEADRQAIERGLAPASERLKLIPLGRLGEPEDVAGVVAFLLSKDANYMTGQAINITGGLWMN